MNIKREEIKKRCKEQTLTINFERTQFGARLKVVKKYLGPYKVEKNKGNGRYDVKVGEQDGPLRSSTCVEYNIKPWVSYASESEADF